MTTRIHLYLTVCLVFAMGGAACGKALSIDTGSSNLAADPLYENGSIDNGPFLAVLGDSISTGVLANTQLGKSVSPSLWVQVLRLALSDWNDPAEIHNALSNPKLAAATTTLTFGLRKSLQERFQIPPLGVVSLAKFGAKATAIPSMLERLAQVEAGHKPADFIFVMMGGNDFCSSQTTEEFSIHYRDALNLVRSTHPQATVVVAPLPPVHQLATVDYQFSPERDGAPRGALTCRIFRDRYCKRVYEADAAAREQAFNKIVEDTTVELSLPTHKIIFAREMMDWQIQADEIAVDCFHPSAKGQEVIGGYLKQAVQRAF